MPSRSGVSDIERSLSGPPRLMIYVQHLLGIGHLVRTFRIAAALAEGLFEVTVVSGGMPVAGFHPGSARLMQLVPLKAGDASFTGLIDADGSPATERDRQSRREHLLRAFDEVRPDVLLTEAFPFGRRAMRFEALPLLEHARSAGRPVLITASIRDILQDRLKPGRAEETAGLIALHYDLVLVHGDGRPSLDATFALAHRFEEKIRYTGMVGPPPDGDGRQDAHDVIVSAGGGAVGLALLKAALDACRSPTLPDLRWLIVSGPNLGDNLHRELELEAAARVDVRRFVPDLAARMHRARISVSQAGYNTVADVLSAGCAAVLVPFAAGGETEQTRRASLLASLRRAVMLAEDTLSGASLALAMREALDLPISPPVPLDGASETGRILIRELSMRKMSGMARPDPALD